MKSATSKWLADVRARGRRLDDRAEAVRLDFERQVNQVVIVLQRVQPRDLDDLPFAEMLAERPERGVGDALVTRRFLHVRQRRTLSLGEERARPVFGERVE